MALLEVEDLTIDIPTAGGLLHALRGVSFTVERGETLAIVGESGSGKSLTALALMNLLPAAAIPTARSLRFDGRDLLTLPRRQREDLSGDRMAMIFQDPMTALNPTWTIGNQVGEALTRHRRVPRAEARDRTVAILEKTGIPAAASRLGQYPHQLSGGLRQRVMIAMALICQPDLIIADEPTTALDVTVQAQILALLRDLQTEFGLALVLITHDLGVVAHSADRVAVMYAGRLVETGPVAQVFANPGHPYTSGLLACIPVPGRTPPGSPLGAIPGQVPALIGEIRGCAFRDRCAHAAAPCADTLPTRSLGPGHTVTCVLNRRVYA
jgi:peptide/nickel transport system ATP-binding protein